MAPTTLSSPPRMATGITLSPKKASDPSTPPRIAPSSMPPTAETIAAMLQESAKMRRTEMPIESATCCEKAVARMAMPERVERKKTVKRTSSAVTHDTLHRYPCETASGPRCTGSGGSTLGKGRVSVPQMPCTIALSTLESPSVTMITEMIGSPMSGRRTTRSSAIPSPMEKARVSKKAAANGTRQRVMTSRQTYAPSRRNSPCAKLRMPLAL